jgi:flagellar biosynthesis/type III secretory pathway protein FliH
MSGTIALRVGKTIGSVKTLSAAEVLEKTAVAAGAKELAAMKAQLQSLCQALNDAVQQTEQYSRMLFAIHREQIIHLAVQIASRVLAHEIQRDNYQIETILTEAITATPGGSILEIRLNPEDLKTSEQSLQSGRDSVHQNITLTADWSIGKAQCIVVTTEGLIEYTIEEHLRQIEAALQATQG